MPTSPRRVVNFQEEIFTVHQRIELQIAYNEKHKHKEDCPCVLCVGLVVALTVMWLTFRAI